MDKLLTRNVGGMAVGRHDRALRMAKRLTRILRNDLGYADIRLHMAQKCVAAGLACRNMHDLAHASFPRGWDGNNAVDLLLVKGFVRDEATAVMAIELLEERHAFVPTAAWNPIGYAWPSDTSRMIH
ncbi:hypothetical protein [Sphingomonas sanguinis]|jgi:hypothetical protein|uniref:Uncharacterized protein n=1 Tax=Sphingomonas sanguinis TaxID=33051 RepID=A0A7Y7QXT0_9SPHN|nr:hypothetical protein [Sphingomonas sanguinis]MBZ6383323.1 hypothetical protein [Sphingomonas sanguinis]NNG48536.1 hypothetical protein [Sphingomonas sanguinis]NNG54241.1 hypothetical protein [Sphingomonas sanguinis]NVP32618.1 hypothetical protein [Sphingomonas sanguinis]